MTVTHVETGYLDTPYLENPYLGVDVNGYMGQQTQFVINANKPMGMQCQIIIADFPKAQGQQANFTFASAASFKGQQADFTVGGSKALGQQAEFNINNFPRAIGQQAEIHINDHLSAFGMQYIQTNIAHLNCDGYLEGDYLEGEYLSHGICGHMGMQATFGLSVDSPYGMQAEFTVVDFKKVLGQQAEFNIVDFKNAIGQQADFVHLLALGMQARISLYNSNLLRILCEFPSRGLSTAVGLNAWGFAAGQGNSWKSNSTETGDFSPFNLNTDIVEETWRSNGVTSGINLDCDTERAQGIFLDTFAMLNHNLTTSATANLIGSNTSNFSVIGVTIPLSIREDDPNTYYIASTLPNAGYRYWRVAIDDPSNPDGYLEVGTIIFGSSNIFIGECFVDQVEFQLKDYTDSVQTEGFTNVNNSRAQKKILRLDFRSLAYLRSNFRLMRGMFRHERTVLKCLWIPTPDPNNPEYTARFAVFSKLAEIPSETHNHKGGDADYVTFQIQLDESK